jgi:AbrB family looped-hinge helix DNA binding protein
MKADKTRTIGEYGPDAQTCCAVDAVVTVDERGQMVLPKDVRQKAGIGAGEKLAVVTMMKEDRVCCVALIKVDEMAGMVQKLIQPLGSDGRDNFRSER